MLKSLIIENCMCHKKSIVKFHKGVNMFIGKSEHGKSAIFNSLYKVMTNRPLGDEWRSWWGGDSKIKLNLGDCNIVYEKSKKTKEKGQYTLINNECEETSFDAVGTTVPQDIVDILKIDRKVNIQKQLERGVPIFLISESPGDVAKFFNKVAGLYKIDETIKAGKEDLKITENEYDTIKETITEKKVSLKQYNNVEMLLSKVTKAEKIKRKIDEGEYKVNTITVYLDNIHRLNKNIKQKENKLKTKDKINKALNISEHMESLNMEIFGIENNLEKIENSNHKIKKHTKNLKTVPKINEALKLVQKIKTNKVKLTALNHLNYTLNLTITKVDTLSISLKQTTVKFNKLMPTKCPLCGK